MKKVKVKKGKKVVLKKNGETKFSKKAEMNMVVEAPDDVEISEEN